MPETLFASTKGRLLRVGLALTGLMLLALGIGGYLFPDSALTYAAITGLNLAIGRAAGMSFGYASGLGHAQVIPLSMLVETIKVLVVYPLFVLSWRHLITLRRLHSPSSRDCIMPPSRGVARCVSTASSACLFLCLCRYG